MIPRPSLHILLIGDASRREFHDACAALDAVARVSRFADAETAAAALAEDRLAPHGIVLAQAQPGQYPPQAIDRLRAAAPLARWFALLGSWCEGEPRSGRPLPGVVRLYWHEAAARFRRELPRWHCPDSAWLLPGTATEEERLLASSAAPLPRGEGLVALWTQRREMAELLADACRRDGYATVWLHPRMPCRVQGAAAAIFDGDGLDAMAVDELKRLTAHVSRAPVVALLGSPRTQDVRLAASLGAAVMGKPFDVDELLWTVNEMLTQRRKDAKTLGFEQETPCYLTAYSSL